MNIWKFTSKHSQAKSATRNKNKEFNSKRFNLKLKLKMSNCIQQHLMKQKGGRKYIKKK